MRPHLRMEAHPGPGHISLRKADGWCERSGPRLRVHGLGRVSRSGVPRPHTCPDGKNHSASHQVRGGAVAGHLMTAEPQARHSSVTAGEPWTSVCILHQPNIRLAHTGSLGARGATWSRLHCSGADVHTAVNPLKNVREATRACVRTRVDEVGGGGGGEFRQHPAGVTWQGDWTGSGKPGCHRGIGCHRRCLSRGCHSVAAMTAPPAKGTIAHQTESNILLSEHYSTRFSWGILDSPHSR